MTRTLILRYTFCTAWLLCGVGLFAGEASSCTTQKKSCQVVVSAELEPEILLRWKRYLNQEGEIAHKDVDLVVHNAFAAIQEKLRDRQIRVRLQTVDAPATNENLPGHLYINGMALESWQKKQYRQADRPLTESTLGTLSENTIVSASLFAAAEVVQQVHADAQMNSSCSEQKIEKTSQGSTCCATEKKAGCSQ